MLREANDALRAKARTGKSNILLYLPFVQVLSTHGHSGKRSLHVKRGFNVFISKLSYRSNVMLLFFSKSRFTVDVML